MKTFADIGALYDVAASWTSERRLIPHPEAEAFSRTVNAFLGKLGDASEEAFWGEACRALRRARWDIAAIPLPFSHEEVGLADAVRRASPRLKACANVAPALSEMAEQIDGLLRGLAESGDDPLGDAVRASLEERGALPVPSPVGAIPDLLYGPAGYAPTSAPELPKLEPPRVCVLVLRARNVRAVREVLSSDGFSVLVLDPQRLRTEGALDSMVAVGPVAWYPPHVVLSPKATCAHFCYFAWLRDVPQPASLLVGTRSSLHDGLVPAPAPGTWTIEARDLVPKANWQAILRAAPRPGDGQAEIVRASLFVLAPGEGVYLSCEDGARAYVAEIGSAVSVRQEPVAEIGPGTFLVIRTEGDGDYIRAIADRLLGTKATALRAKQDRWSAQLREALEVMGAEEVVRELKKAGATHASVSNVRRWSERESIRTRDPADFFAILKLAGREHEAQDDWGAMGEIHAAHVGAGQRVRSLLVKEISKGDAEELAGRGWADYDVEEIEGEGTLRVSRVEARSPRTVDVAIHQTRRLFELDRDLWQG